jgi:hypothetical protein
MTLGQPLPGAVSLCGGVWSCPAYYSIQVPAGQGFRVLVTQFSGAGAVDLFGSDQWNPVPGPAPSLQSNWSSVTYAPVQIVDVPAGGSCGGAATCPFYFSVAPFNAGLLLYSIVATSATATVPIVLADGKPQTNLAVAGTQNYYNISVTPGSSFHSLTISTAPYYGEADVYVTVNDGSGLWPSPTNNLYAASGITGSNLLYMSYADPKFSSVCPPNGGACNVAIAVGYSLEDCMYTISATSSTAATSLANGIPASGYVSAGAYAYFNFTPAFAGNFTIYVTALAGDPDVSLRVQH